MFTLTIYLLCGPVNDTEGVGGSIAAHRLGRVWVADIEREPQTIQPVIDGYDDRCLRPDICSDYRTGGNLVLATV